MDMELPLPGARRSRGTPGFLKQTDNLANMAAAMRAIPTQHEALMRELLLKMKVAKEFKEQEVLYGYIADFWHSGIRLNGLAPCRPFIIEVDGWSHRTVSGRNRDRRRDEVFVRNGVRVLRIANETIAAQPKDVAKVIKNFLETKIDEPITGIRMVVRI